MRFSDHYPFSEPSHGSSPDSITAMTAGLLKSFTDCFAKRNIEVETDLSSFESKVDPDILRTVVGSLIENAIESMPDGGELSVTLMGDHQHLELEIADTGVRKTNRWGEERPRGKHRDRSNELCRIVASSESFHLKRAQRAATQHGWQIQTWDCPQGGTANVLVVPTFKQRRRAA